MAEKQYGTAHIFGIDANVTNLTITAVDLEKNFNLDQKTTDQLGVTIENRMDDRMITGTITAFVKSGYTFPAQGDLITLADMKDSDHDKQYCIKRVGGAEKAGDKYVLTLTLEWHEGITYSSE
ncbi:hypothetical protein QEH52_01785 [Coraliomargarita sp. SDUM461003]|uniref:Phage tail protein n=1 Tax=Thalassobacterium maritimum TaxID=3041265 RepID=A0ABU1AQA7_9BACT|nr:hypothetical protein [Coraliomargarita sp. SDUM461003]MDQ8206223.1 hypothetical protein [Coraliomargarita sp. SDUM461003]